MSSLVSDRAERLVQQRSVAAIVLSAALIVSQGQRMDDGGGGLVSWAIWGLAAAIFFLWASGLLGSRLFRALVNDETSDLNRRRAIVAGFWAMLGSAAICFILTFVKDYGPRDAIQVVMTTGLSAALLHFGISERRALRA